MKKFIKTCKTKFDYEDISPLEVLLNYGTLFIFVMALLLVIAPTIITFTIIPPDTVPQLGSIVKFSGYTIGVLPAIEKGHNLFMVGICSLLTILWIIMRKTRLFCLNVIWDYLQVMFWISQTIYFLLEGPFLLRAGFCGLYSGSALYIIMDLISEKKKAILSRLEGK